MIPFLLLGSAGWVLNDITGWIGRDDGTPPPMQNKSNLLVNTLVLGGVAVGTIYVYKRFIRK